MKSEPSTVLNPSAPAATTSPPLVQALQASAQASRFRFHTPAHAGRAMLPAEWDLAQAPYRYDLTELDGLDVLSEPSSCIQAAQEQAAGFFGVAHSFFLVNGASVGLMAAMLSALKPGDTVLLPRNVHRSVLSGLILTGAEPIWMLPERISNWGLWGAVTVADVQAHLDQHPQVKALVITSPTYEGLGSDVATLAQLCRARGVYLVVDEAHGSLWPFTDRLPQSAAHTACDAVIHSLHKSGGSLTQSALAHLPTGSRLDATVFQQALNTLQTTSPSYLLMASLDATVHYLASPAGQAHIDQLLNQTEALRQRLHENLGQLQLREADRRLADPCKLYFRHPGQTGTDWGDRLEAEQGLAYESASPYGVLYLANLGLTDADFDGFYQLIKAEDDRAQAKQQPPSVEDKPISLPVMALSPREAFFAPGRKVPPAAAVNRIAKETVVHCPPGIPVLFPGERIQAHHLPFLPETGVLVVT